MKIQNGIVQREKSEVDSSWISSNQWIEGPDSFYYYNNPFNQTPWTSFYGKPVAKGVPTTFLTIFGPKPTDIQALNFWEQQLGLFAKTALPPNVSEAAAQNINDLCSFYGVGKLVSWLTTRGDYIVTPTEVPELFNTEDFGPDIYDRPLQGITILQVALLNKGIKPVNLSPFLTNLRIEHQG